MRSDLYRAITETINAAIDARAIVTAASRAQVAADYLVGLAEPVAAATELQ
jgi:antirestriction protein ArdC